MHYSLLTLIHEEPLKSFESQLQDNFDSVDYTLKKDNNL